MVHTWTPTSPQNLTISFFPSSLFFLFLHKLCSWPFEWIYKIYFWPTFLLLLLRLSPRNLAEPKDLGARQRRPPKCCVSEQTFPSLTPSLLQFLCHSGQEQALKGRSLMSLTRQRLNLTKTAASGGPQEQARTFWIFREENKLTCPAWSSVYAKLAGRDLQPWAETRFGLLPLEADNGTKNINKCKDTNELKDRKKGQHG